MYTHYTYLPATADAKKKWHFGWNSCLLFMTSLLLLTLYAIAPVVPLRVLLSAVMVISALGSLSALYSMFFCTFWLGKTYAACGLIGNVCVPLLLLLELQG